jgi:hypothetical protein
MKTTSVKWTITNVTSFYCTFALDQLRSITREWNRIWERTLELEALEKKCVVWKREMHKLETLMRVYMRSVDGTPQLKNWRRLQLRLLAANLCRRHGVEHFEPILGILAARHSAPDSWAGVRADRIARAKKRGLELDPREIAASDEASRFFVRSEQTVPGFVACNSYVRHLFYRDIYV